MTCIYLKVTAAFETTEVINCYTPLVPEFKFKDHPRAYKKLAPAVRIYIDNLHVLSNP